MDKEKIKEENIKNLYKHREFLDKTRVGIATSFDKYLLTFASGSLYLSILFTNAIKKDIGIELIKKNFLCTGWIFLLGSIVLMLLSIYASVKAHEKAMDLDNEIIKSIEEDHNTIVFFNCWSKIVDICEIIGGIFFVVGLSFLSYFYFINL